MKWLFASDIHGSAFHCRKLMEAYDRERADKLILLGDLLYHGPRNPLPEGYAPMEVARMLNERRAEILCVRGNCDAEVDQMVLDFPIMAPHMILSAFGYDMLITHGHLNDTPHIAGGIVMQGHTHIPLCEKRGDHILMNPGSVSLPKNGAPRGYVVLDEDGFRWKLPEGEIYNHFVQSIKEESHHEQMPEMRQ